MKLFYSPGTSALAARILIIESRLPIQYVRVRASVGVDEDGRDFRALSTSRILPALCLEDDSLVETEVDIALELVKQMPPDPVMAPAVDTPAYEQLRACLTYLAENVHEPFKVVLQARSKRSARAAAMQTLTKAYAHLDGIVARQPFVLGKGFTAADAYTFALLSWNPLIELDTSPWPGLENYVERLKSRPSVVEALAAEGLTEGWNDDLQPLFDPSLRA